MLARSIAVVVMIAASHGIATEPELGRPFDLRPSETARLGGLQLTFESVSDDSRCPTGVQCVWAGDAAATFTLQKAPSAAAQRILHTSARFERQTAYEEFVVRLEDIKPYPREGVTIAPDEYRATLVVTRR